MTKSNPPIGWRMLKWLVTLLTILYAAQVFILPRLQPGVEYADAIKPFYLLSSLLRFGDSFTLLLDIVIAIAICVGLHILIDRHCEAVANREKDAARLREEAARFSMTSMRMAGTKVAQQTEPMLTPIMEWCVAATAQIPKSQRNEFFLSQLDQLTDQRDQLVKQGYSLDAAERAAVEAMGTPNIAAQQLRRAARTPDSFLRGVEYCLTGRGWVILYKSEYKQSCQEVMHVLSALGIEFRANQRSSQQNHSYMQAASMGGAVRSGRTGPSGPNIYNIASVTTADVPADQIHSILIRKRDAALARRLVR